MHEPRALRKNPLVRRFFGEPAAGNAGRTRDREALERIHQLVRQGAERCRDADLLEGNQERALRQYAIVTLQCLERRPVREVAATLGISFPHCYRERAAICRRVAGYIAEQDDASALDYFPELDEFRVLADQAMHRAAFGDMEAALREGTALLAIAPSPHHKIEALRIGALVALQFGDVARAQAAYARAQGVWTEQLANETSVEREIAQASIELIGLELASNAGDTARVLRAARRAAARLEPIAERAPSHVRELYVDSLFNLGIALANLGSLEEGYDCIARAADHLTRIRPASAELRSFVMSEAARVRGRLLLSSQYCQPPWQRRQGLAEAFELAYTSGASLASIRALVGLTEHHAFGGNGAEAVRAARAAVLLAKQYPNQRIVAHTSISVVLPLLSTERWERGCGALTARSATAVRRRLSSRRAELLRRNARAAVRKLRRSPGARDRRWVELSGGAASHAADRGGRSPRTSAQT